MASNRTTRLELERIYGEGSMYQKAKTDEYLSTLPRVKTYKKYLEEKHYTRKQRLRYEQTMTYHHLKHKSEGGRTTTENGAVVSDSEHQFLHSLPREQEEIINNHIRQWKQDFIILMAEQVVSSGELTVINGSKIDINLDTDYIEIPTQDYYKPHKTKLTKQQLYARQLRREKRELQKLKKELEDRWYKRVIISLLRPY